MPMERQKKRNRGLKLILILAGIGVVLILMSISMARTSTTQYCMSCHEMKRYKTELEKSSHAVDKDKQPIACRQCHIPAEVGPKYVAVKVYLGMKDMITHYFGDPENLDRREMQQIARRFIPDENCRKCHQDLFKTTEGKDISEIGKLCHEAYLGTNGTTCRSCTGCHFNLAHLPRFDRRYFFNAEFAQRLPLEQENK